MNSIRSSSRAISFLMRTLILTSHASFAPFVLYEPIMFFLSGHLYKISLQSLSSPISNVDVEVLLPVEYSEYGRIH